MRNTFWAHNGLAASSPPSRRLLKISARRHPGRCPGLQSQMRQDALDHRRFEDGRNDPELAAAVRAVLDAEMPAPQLYQEPR